MASSSSVTSSTSTTTIPKKQGPRSRYICVTCGTPNDALYKQLSCDVLMLLHCAHCGHVIDEYIEYDPPLIAIDIILQRHQAYRHILFNAGPKPFWKLAVILLLCDAYALWAPRRPQKKGNTLPEYRFPIQPEWDFYSMSGVAIAEAVAFAAIVLSGMALMSGHFWGSKTKSFKDLYSPLDLIHAMIVGGCGKVLAVPASIWAIQDSTLYVGLATLFMLLSQMHVLEAVTRVSRVTVILIVVTGFAVQYGIRVWLLAVL